MRPRNSGSPRRWRISRARLRKLALDLFKQCLVSLIILTHLSSILVAQQIVTDGRTQTSLNTSGTVTDVTTATISGNNAFNSFTKFDVDGGNVVNLHVPNGTNNLLNFVTAERTDIHGTLNAIKDNQIGGNVYFANPHGIVIGAAGVVNVGALNLSTPTQAFVDGAMDGVNAPNAAAASALLDGTAAINGGAVVTVEGTINAVEDIRIQTGAATNSGTIQSGAIYAGSAANFSDIVNTNGYESGTAVVATASGDIVIEAQSSVSSTGTIATNAANAGNISVSAANVTVGGTVSSASETAAGSSGDLELEATGALTINSGTVLKVTEGTPAQPAQEGRLRLAGGTSVSLPANYNLKAGSIEIDTGSTLDLSGTMTAVGGDVSIDAIGWLSIHNDVEAAGDVNLTSSGGSVEIDADITTSGGSIDIDSADGVAVQGTLSSSDEDFDVEDWLASNGNIDIDAAGDVTIDGTLIVTAAEISLADFLALIEDVTLGEMIADLVGNPTVDLPDSITVEGIEIDLPDSMALLDLLDSVADLNLNGILTGYVEGSDVDQLSLNDLRDALGRTTLAEVLDGLGVNGITDVLNDVANSVQEVFRGEDVEVGLALTDVLPEIRFRDYLPSDGNIEIESGGAVTVDGLFSTIDFDEAGHIEVLADGELTVAMGTSFATQNPMLIDDGSYLELVGGEGVEIINATNWAVGALDIESGANLDIHFNVQAIDGDIRLEAAGGLVLTNTGGLTLSVIDSDGGGKAGNIELIAGTAMSMGANNAFLANDANRVDDGGVIVMRNGTMFLPNSLELAYGGLDIETGGSLSIPYDFSAIDGDIRIVTGGDLTLPSGRQIATVDSDGGGSAGSVTLEAGGTLDLGSAVVLDADDVDGNNDGGKVTLYGEAGISLLSDLTLRAHSVDIESAVALNVPLALTAAGGNLRLASGADLTPIFNLTAGDRLELEADGDIALNGIAVSGRDIVATAGGDISVFTDLVAVEGASDLVESRGNIRLTAGGSILIAEVEVQALGGEIVIDAGGDVVVQNTLFADDGTFDLPDWRASNGSITVNAGGTVSIQDNWTATGAEISLADFLGLFDDVRFGDFLESLVGNPTVDLPDKITVLGVEFDTPNSLALLDLLGPAADVTLAEVLTRYVEGTAADQVSVNDLRSALGRTTVADVLDELGVNELTDVLSDVLADIEEALPGIDFDVDVRLTDVLPEIRLRDLLPSDGNIEVYAGGTITVANSKAITVVDDDVSGNIELVAGGALILGSNVDLAARRTAALNSGGAVYLEGEDGVTLPVSLDLLAGDITIISGTGLTVPWGLSAPDGDIELRAKDGDLNIATGATLTTLDDAGGGSGDITLVSGGNIPVSSITFLAEDASLDNDGGKVTMHAGGTLAIPQVSFLLRYGSLDLESGDSLTIPYSLYGLDGDIRIAVDGLLGIANGLTFSSIDSDGGTTAGDLDLYGGQGIAIPSDWTARGRNITIGSGLDLDIPVALYTEDFIGVTVSTTGDLHLYAGDNLFIGGDLTADEGSVTLDAGADVTLTSGKSISAEAVEVSAGNSIVAPNVAIAATKTNIAMTADNDITFSDGGSMTASEGEIDLFAADDIMVGGGMTIHAEDIDIEAGGDISIRSDMTATEGWPSLNGIIEAGHQLDLGDLLDELEEVPLDLIFKASGNVALEADGNIAIEGVTLHADGGNVDIDAGKSISVDGTLIAEAGDVSLADLLLPDGEITLNARDGSITLNGTLRSSPGPLSINSIKNALGDLSLLDLLNLGGNTTIADLEALGFDITGFIVDLDKQISLGLGSYLDYFDESSNDIAGLRDNELLATVTLDDFLVLGGDIQIEADGYFTTGANTLLTTRQINGDDYLNASSVNDSGEIDIFAKNITIAGGTQLLTHVHSGSSHADGDINIEASDSRFSYEELLEILLDFDFTDPDDYFDILEEYWGILTDRLDFLDELDGVDDTDVDITITGATIKGRDVNISSFIHNPSIKFVRDAGGKVVVGDTAISARDVVIRAEADTSIFPDAIDEFIETLIDLGEFANIAGLDLTEHAETVAVDVFNEVLNYDFFYQESSAITEARLTGTSQIEASGNVTISAESEIRANPVGDFFVINGAYADGTAMANAAIDDTAVVIAGGDFEMGSEITTDISAKATQTWFNTPALVFTVADVVTESTASIADGAQVTADNVTVAATSDNEIATVASGTSLGGGYVVLSAGVELLDATTTASVGGTVVSRGDIEIEAESAVRQTSHAAASNSGNADSLVTQASTYQTWITNWDIIGQVMSRIGPYGMTPKSSSFSLGAAVSVVIAENDVDAFIADGATVKADGAIAIDAYNYDDLNNIARGSAASVGSAVAGAAAWGVYTDTARASIGSNAVVDAGEAILIDSQVEVPRPWDAALADAEDLYTTLLETLGIGLVLTSFSMNGASGSNNATDWGLAGSFNYFDTTHTSESFIGAGAQINQDEDYRSAAQDVSVYADTFVGTVNGQVNYTLGQNAIGGTALVHLAETSAEAYIDDAAVVYSANDVDIDADSDLWTVDSIVSGGSSSGVSLSGALLYMEHDNEALAYVGNGAEITALDAVIVDATANAQVVNVGGGVYLTSDSAIGATANLLFLENTADAYFEGGVAEGTVDAASLDIAAKIITGVQGYALAGSVTTNTNGSAEGVVSGQGALSGIGVAGDAIFHDVTSEGRAYIGSGWEADLGGTLVVDADHDLNVRAIAGAVSISTNEDSEVGIAGSYVHNVVSDETKAYVEGDITVGPGNDPIITAEIDRTVWALNASLSGSTQASNISGSVAVNDVTGDTLAYLSGSVAGAEDLVVWADDTTWFITVAGSIAIAGGDVGAGGALAYTAFDGSSIAYIDGDIDLSGNLTLTAATDLELEAASLGAAGTTGSGEGGSPLAAGAGVTYSELDMTTRASLGGSAAIDGSAAVIASSDSEILSISGDIAGSAGGSAFGGASSVVKRSDTVHAYLDPDSELTVGGGDIEVELATDDTETVNGLTVAAVSEENIQQYTAGAAIGAGGSGVEGAVTVGDHVDTTVAWVGADTNIDSGGDINVRAEDFSELFTVSGGIGGGSNGGFGAGIDVGLMNKTTRSYLDDGTEVEAAGDVFVTALSDEDVSTISGAIGVGGSTGLAGAASGYDLTVTTEAYGEGDAIVADDNVVIAATEDTQFDVIAGTIAGGGSTGVGASVGVLKLTKTTKAWIGADSSVTALSFGETFAAPTGEFAVDFDAELGEDGEVEAPTLDSDSDSQILTNQRVADTVTSHMQGVSVTATNRDDVEAIAASGTGSGTGAAAISNVVAVVDATTHAYAGDNAQINQGPTSDTDQSVNIAAGNDYYHMGIAGSASGAGTVAAAPGVDVSIFAADTRAWVGTGADVDANRDVRIKAFSQQEMLSVAAGLAGSGEISVAGGTQYYKVDNTTYAYSAADLIDAGGTLLIEADDHTEEDLIAGAAAIAGAGAAGGAVIVTTIDKDTQARIDRGALTALGNSSLDGKTGINVAADTSENIFAVGASGSGALTGAVAGAVVVSAVASDTKALVGDSVTINRVNSGANAAQDVRITATNESIVHDHVGALSVGLSGGLAGAVDVQTIRNNTVAAVGTAAKINAADAIVVDANSTKDSFSVAVSGSAGSTVAVAGAVGIYLIADDLDSTQEDNLNDITSFFNSQATDSTGTSLLGSSSQSGASELADSVEAAIGSTAPSASLTGVVSSGTSATVGLSAQLTAGGNIEVGADEDIDFESYLGGASISATAGAGAGIGLAQIDNDALTYIASSSVTDAGGELIVSAERIVDASILSMAGSLSLGIGANAAFATIDDAGNSTADLHGLVVAADAVTVSANDYRDLDVEAYGGSAGVGGAAGASIAMAKATGTTRAAIGNSSQITPYDGAHAATVDVVASGTTLTAADAVAAGAGVGAAVQGTVTEASSTRTVQASIGNSATVAADDDVTVHAKSEADNHALSGVGTLAGGAVVGLAESAALSTNTVSASIGNASAVSGGHVGVFAVHNFDVDYGARAKSVGAAGAIGLAGSGAFSEASHILTINAAVGAGANVSGTGSQTAYQASQQNSGIGISSIGDADAVATADNYNGGALAFGESQSTTTSSIVNDATLGSGATLESIYGDISIAAASSGASTADTTGGQGGVFADSSTRATSQLTRSTEVTIGDQAIIDATGNVALLAQTSDDVASADAEITTVAGVALNRTRATTTANVGNTLEIGEDVEITGAVLSLFARVLSFDISSDAQSTTIAAGSDSQAYATTNATASTDVNIRSGAILKSYGSLGLNIVSMIRDSARVEAGETVDPGDSLFGFVKSDAFAKGDIFGATGNLKAVSVNNFTTDADVLTEAGSYLQGGAVSITAQAPHDAQASFDVTAIANANTVVNYVLTEVEEIVSYVENIPVIGSVVRKVTKKVLKWVAEILQSDVSNSATGGLNSDNTITHNGVIRAGYTGDPLLVIGADGTIVQNVQVELDSTPGCLDCFVVTNLDIGGRAGIEMIAQSGTVTGNGTVATTNRNHVATIINNSDKDLILGDIGFFDAQASGGVTTVLSPEIVSSNGADPDGDGLDSNGDPAQAHFTIINESVVPQLLVENHGDSDVYFSGAILTSQVPYYDMSVTNSGGDIGMSTVWSTPEINQVRELVLYAPQGEIDLQVDLHDDDTVTPTVWAEAKHDVALALGAKVQRNSGALAPEVEITHVQSGLGDIAIVSQPGTVATYDPGTGIYSIVNTDADIFYTLTELLAGGSIDVSGNGFTNPLLDVRTIKSGVRWGQVGDVNIVIEADGSFSSGAGYALSQTSEAITLADLSAAGGVVSLFGTVYTSAPESASIYVHGGSHSVTIENDSALDLILSAVDLGAVTGEVYVNGTLRSGSSYNSIALETASGGTNEIAISNRGPSDIQLTGNLSGSQVTIVNDAGSIHDLNDVHINATSLDLTAIDGGISSLVGDGWLNATVGAGGIDALASDDITLSVESSSPPFVQIGQVKSIDGSVAFQSEWSLNDRDGDAGAEFAGDEIWLRSEIGSLHLLEIDSRSAVTLHAGLGSIEVQELSGNLLLRSATAATDSVKLTAAGSILDVDSDADVDVTGSSVELTASAGSIGSAANLLEIDSSTAVTLTAQGDIAVAETSGDMKLSQATSTSGDVTLQAAGSISDKDNDSGADVSGDVVSLSALNGSIGALASILEISATGAVSLDSRDGVYVDQLHSDGLELALARATNGSVRIVSPGSIDLDNVFASGTVTLTTGGDIDAGGDPATDITGNGVTLTASNGRVVADVAAGSGAVTVTAGGGDIDLALSSNGGVVTLIASDDIDVNAGTSDILLELAQAGDDITLIAGSILDADADDDSDLDVTGWQIAMTATTGNLGGGSRGLEVEHYDSNNHHGSVRLISAGDIVINGLGEDLLIDKAQAQGDVTLSTARAITATGSPDYSDPTISGEHIHLAADAIGPKYEQSVFTSPLGDKHYLYSTKSGPLVIDSTASLTIAAGDGGVYLYELGDVHVGSIAAISSPPDGYTSQAVISLTAEGSIIGDGNGDDITGGIGTVQLYALGGDIDLDVDLNDLVSVDTIASGSVDLESDGTLLLYRVLSTSRADVTLEGSEVIGQTNLGVTGGHVKVTATSGNISQFVLPLQLDSTSVELIAGGDLYAEEVDGDLNIAHAESGGFTYLLAGGSILGISDLLGAHVIGSDVWLGAGLGNQAGTIGKVDDRLWIDSNGFVRLDAASDIYLNEIAGDLNLASATSTYGGVSLTAPTSILDHFDDGAADVVGGRIELIVGMGTLGSATNDLDILASDAVRLVSATGMWIEQTAGDLVIESAWSQPPMPPMMTTNDIYLTAAGAIRGREPFAGATHIIGHNITLNADSIGANGDALTIDSGTMGMPAVVTLSASGDVVLTEVAGDLNLNGTLSSEGEVDLTADGSIQGSAVAGTYDIDADSVALTSLNGNLANLTLKAESIELDAETGAIGDIEMFASTIDMAAQGDITAYASKADVEFTSARSEEGDIDLSSFTSMIASHVVAAQGNVTLAVVNDPMIGGDLRLGLIMAQGDVTVSAPDAILESTSDSGHDLVGTRVAVTSYRESIGSAADALELDSEYVNLFAEKEIYASEVQGALNIERVEVSLDHAGTIALTSADSIYDNNADDAADIIGIHLQLSALNGEIGAIDNHLDLQTFGTVTATADGDVWLDALFDNAGPSFLLGGITSLSGDVSLSSNGRIRGDASAAVHVSGDQVSLAAFSSIDGEVDLLNVESNRLDATVTDGHLRINEISGDLNVGRIAAGGQFGDVVLTANGAILDADDDSAADIEGSTIHLTSAASSIGTIGNALEVNDGALTVTAPLDVNVAGSGDLRIDAVESHGGDVRLATNSGAIVESTSDAAADVIGRRVEISAANGINLDFDAERVALAATGSEAEIDVATPNGDFNLELVTAGGDITLTTPGSILDADGDAAADVVTTNDGEITLDAAGSVGSATASLGIDQGDRSLTVFGDTGVYISSDDDLYLTNVWAMDGDVQLAAAGNICGGNFECFVDSPAMIRGRHVSIVTGGDFGPNGASGVTLLADIDNPTPTLSLVTGGKANLWLGMTGLNGAEANASVSINSVTTQITVANAGDVELTSIDSGSLQVRHRQGNRSLTIAEAVIDGTVDILTDGDIYFGDVDATGKSVFTHSLAGSIYAYGDGSGIHADNVNLSARGGAKTIGEAGAALGLHLTGQLNIDQAQDAYFDLELLDSALAINSMPITSDLWMSVTAASPSVLALNGTFSAGGDITLLGDANTTFGINTNVRSGTSSGTGTIGSLAVDVAGNVTAQGVTYLDDGSNVTVDFTADPSTSRNGHITITGNVAAPVQGSGSLQIVNESSELSIDNQSSKTITLGNIDLGTPGTAGAITLNGVPQSPLPSIQNGVTLSHLGAAGSGDLSVTSASDVRISGTVRNDDGSIVMHLSDGDIFGEAAGRLTARSMDLNALNGSIFGAADTLQVDVGSGVLDAKARDYIAITDYSGDLEIGAIAASIVELSAAVSIFDGSDDAGVDVSALSATLNAAAQIGNDNRAIGIAADTLYLSAGDTIAVTDPTGNLDVDLAISTGGSISLSAASDVRLGRVVATEGTAFITAGRSIIDVNNDSSAEIEAKGVVLQADGGSVGETFDALDVIVAELGLSATAQSDVRVATTGDLAVAHVEGGGEVVLSANGLILDADPAESDGDADIAAGGKITLAATAIGSEDNAVELDSARTGSGKVTLTGTQGIYAYESDGDLHLASATASAGDVSLGAQGTILDADGDAAADVQGANIVFTSSGGIGTAGDRLELATAGSLSASAQNGIYLESVSGNLAIASVASAAGDVVLVAAGSLDDALAGDGANVTGKALTLQAGSTGMIGSATDSLRIDSDGAVSVSAVRGDVYLTETAGGLQLTALTAGGRNSIITVANGDLAAGVLSAKQLKAEVSGGSAHIAAFIGSRLTGSVTDEGGAFVVDQIQLDRFYKPRIEVRADNIHLADVGYVNREMAVTYDLTGNDGGMADSVQVSGTTSKKTTFDRLYTHSGTIDIDSNKAGRANKIRVNELINDDGVTFLTETLQVEVAPGEAVPFRLDITGRGHKVKPRDLNRDITASLRP